MSNAKQIIRVALPVPLRKAFDYCISSEQIESVRVGSRVRVSFGRRELIGIIVELSVMTNTPEDKIKHCMEVLDKEPLLSESLLDLANWISRYYLAPLGMVLELMLPKDLRLGKDVQPKGETVWRLTSLGYQYPVEKFKSSPAKKKLLQAFYDNELIDQKLASNIAKSWRTILKAFLILELIEVVQQAPTEIEIAPQTSAKKLTTEQEVVVTGISAQTGFQPNLIYGVTGSGKTEVYLSIIEQHIKAGKQALILVPEIGLTPQLIDRVKVRLSARVAAVHSEMTDKERHLAWWRAKHGKVDVVLGTRTAVFTPFKELAMIVVDEEHDLSFKQQDGVRYHARDVAMMRAKHLDIPIVVGSATPALETYFNSQSDKYQYWQLTQRATGMEMPSVHMIDVEQCRGEPNFAQYGLSPNLVEQIKRRIAKGEQSLLFINRRGFAPTMYCPECAVIAKCERCNMHFTRHQAFKNNMILRCHHCGYDAKHSRECASCHKADMLPIGLGTQRIEEGLTALFPEAKFMRVDRDALSAKGDLDQALETIRDSKVDIVVGTQLLTKGHDFPNVTLVGILDADKGLFSVDFRASERLFQQVLQVAGRAGRHKKGQVYIQTQFPENEIFTRLQQHDYSEFAGSALQERSSFAYPPFGNIALLRAESVVELQGKYFLRACLEALPATPNVKISDPVSAPMEKLAGKYRAQVMFKAERRNDLHTALNQLMKVIEASPLARKVRWSIDVDPVDMY